MTTKKPKGYFKYLLALDCETSGMAYNSDDPSFDKKNGDIYQAVSWGFVVVDADTLKSVEELYVEIKWDGKSKWSPEAERIHGLSREYLDKNGMDVEDAVVAIGSLLLKYWGPDSPVSVCGHNAIIFDLPFLKRTLRSMGLEVIFAHRHIDTNTLGFALFSTYTSDQLFEHIGLPARKDHNALDDAKSALQVLRIARAIAEEATGE